ncbi:hypothetical protein ACFL6I_27755, partial [candidate division KSB1 bacterium]
VKTHLFMLLMKRFIMYLVLLLLPSSLLAQSTVWFNGSFEQAREAALNEGKSVVVVLSLGDG